MAAMFVNHRDEVYGDPGVHALSVAYFENLRNSPLAHRLSMEMLTVQSPLDDRAKTICLGIIADYIRTSYPEDATNEVRNEVHTFLARYADVHLCDRRVIRQEDAQVLLLAAEIFGLVGLVDYPLHRPDFFVELVSIAGLSSRGVDHFLRTLRVISHTVAGQPISEEEFDKNLVFVKVFEQQDFKRVLDTLYCVLVGGEANIKRECMRVMCEYMVLIEPEYFSRHEIITHLLDELKNMEIQKNVLACVFDLLTRMQTNKEEHREFVGRVFQQLVTRDLARPDHPNERFSVRIGSLLSVIGSHLLRLLKQGDQGEYVGDSKDNTKHHADLNAFLPYIFNFVDSKTISISSSAIPFFLDYTKFLKQRPKLSLEEYNNFIKLLGIVMLRIKMKSTYVFEEEPLERKQDEFMKYRITLMNLFDIIATVKRKVVFKGISQLILKNLVKKDWTREAFNVAEYPVFLIHFLSKSYWWQDQAVKPSKALLMRALLNSDIVSHPHPAVTEQFFKVVGANVNFFRVEPKFIPPTLSAFLNRALKNFSKRVQHTGADQMLNFVKGLTSHLNDSFLDIITTIKSIAIIPTSFIEGPRSSMLRPGVRLSLFETYGLAICHGKFHKQNKRHFLAEILVPTMHMYHDSCNAWATTRDQEVCAGLICRAMDVVTAISRPFDAATATCSGCDDVFIDTVTILDHCPMSQLVRSDIHMATARLIRQMVVCLDEKFIPFIPKMLQGMFCCKAEENVAHITEVLIDIINKHKRRMFSYFRYEFLRICFHIYDAFTVTHKQHPIDDQQRLDDRQKLFLSFLKALVDNSMLIEIFVVQDEKTVAKLIAMIASAALDGSRGEWRAKGLSVLTHIVDKWARPSETHSKYLVKFVYDYMVKACYVAMRDAIDNLDGSFLNYLDVFSESARLIETMYTRRGDEMIAWLIQDYLPQLNVSSQLSEELVDVVIGNPVITLEDYLKSFFFEAEDIHIPPLHPFTPMSLSSHHIIHTLSNPLG